MKNDSQLQNPHRRHFFIGSAFLALAWLAFSAAQAQTTNYALGTTNLSVGPAAGTNSVVLGVTPATGTWTNTANAAWLHLSLANQSGTGSTNLVFSYDANPGATRSGTLTIGGQTLTVTQAGSSYVPAGSVTTLLPPEFDAEGPSSVAVDCAGNVYTGYVFGDTKAGGPYSYIMEWKLTNNGSAYLVYDIAVGLFPPGVAVDCAGNVYIADSGNNAIEERTATNSNLTTLVSGLNSPAGVALDGAGNVYIADTYNSAVKEWTAASNTVTTLVSAGVSYPFAVALDGAGNLYIADTADNAIKVWSAVNSNVISLVSAGLNAPTGVAVDGAGNVYIADEGNGAIKEWTAANSNLTTLVASGINQPWGVAVDGAGNVYIADYGDDTVQELPSAFVDPTAKLEGLAAGNDSLQAVLPATENLLPPFNPTSDQPWLTITGITNGVVSFSFTADTGPARTANITLLGQTISITQGTIGTPPTLTGVQMLGSNVLQFGFTNTQTASFTVLSTTNLFLPLSNWTVVGTASNTAPGVFEFTSQPTTNDPQLFYRVRSP